MLGHPTCWHFLVLKNVVDDLVSLCMSDSKFFCYFINGDTLVCFNHAIYHPGIFICSSYVCLGLCLFWHHIWPIDFYKSLWISAPNIPCAHSYLTTALSFSFDHKFKIHIFSLSTRIRLRGFFNFVQALRQCHLLIAVKQYPVLSGCFHIQLLSCFPHCCSISCGKLEEKLFFILPPSICYYYCFLISLLLKL